MTEERLAEIERRLERGQGPDPWSVMGNTVDFSPRYWIALPGDIPKAELIAHAPEDLRDLIAEVRQFRSEGKESGGAPLLVRCSCGEVVTLNWNSEASRYECDNPTWEYDGEWGARAERLWNCGKPGHRQDGVRAEP